MTSQEFCYWLQGFFEMTDAKELTPEQVKMVREHLQLVFKKVTSDRLLDKLPDIGGPRQPPPPSPAELERQQQELAEFRRQLEEYRRKKQTVPLQQPPYIQWKMPEQPQCGDAFRQFQQGGPPD